MKRFGVCLFVALLAAACSGNLTSSPEPEQEPVIEGADIPEGTGTEGESGSEEDGPSGAEEQPAEPGSGIKGVVHQVTAKGDLSPLVGATVSVLGSNPKLSVTTGTDGTYALAVPDGTHWVFVVAPGRWGVVEQVEAPVARAILPIPLPDEDSFVAELSKANGAALDATKGIVRVTVSKFSEPLAIAAGVTVTLSTGVAKTLVSEGTGFVVASSLPAGPDGVVGAELLGVGTGVATVQVTAPSGLACTPAATQVYVEPKAFTSLEVTCE